MYVCLCARLDHDAGVDDFADDTERNDHDDDEDDDGHGAFETQHTAYNIQSIYLSTYIHTHLCKHTWF